jgi:hypothetical protein
MRRPIAKIAILLAAVCFSSMTCKDNGVSPPPPIAKPDTTSDNFTWTSYTLGDGNGSILYDVSLVNDTLGYAVGEIYLKDSTGQINPTPFNLATWDGLRWQLLRMMFPLCDKDGNQLGSGPYSANGVFASTAAQMWSSCDVSLIEQVSGVFEETCMPLAYGQRNLGRMWGNGNDLYLVGTNGFIAHYNGNTSAGGFWSQVTSGTTAPINDILGTHDPTSGVDTIYCVATDPFQSAGQKILRITNGSTVDTIGWGPGRDLFTVWTCPGAPLYVGGGGLWKNVNGAWQQIDLGSNSAVLCIRGNASNDVFVVGTFGLLAHFNGNTWHTYTGITSATLSRVSVKGNTVAAVGEQNGLPFILIGKRQ